MDLETALADPALDLPVPADALYRVHKKAAGMQRRRAALVGLTGAAVVAVLLPVVLGGNNGRPEVLYGSPSASPPTTRIPAAQQLQTMCILSPGGTPEGVTDLIGPTGDPVENCARYWRHARNAEPPALVAYQDRDNQVMVQEKSLPLPAGARLLPLGVVQDPEAVIIMEALSDPIGMGPDHCRDEATARADATRAVTPLGFANWPVRVDSSRTNPAVPQCWSFAPDLRRHVVTVAAVEGNFDYPVAVEQIARPLRASLTRCWTRAEALRQVRSAVARSSLAEEFKALAYIRQVDDAKAKCTSVRLGGGGGVEITLRGPA